jgi:hypothetical protein
MTRSSARPRTVEVEIFVWEPPAMLRIQYTKQERRRPKRAIVARTHPAVKAA